MYSKVLIVSASIGAGHTRAAEAIQAEMAAQGIAHTSLVDFFDGQDGMSRLVKDVYFKMLDIFPHAYEALYRWSHGQRSGSNLSDLAAFAMKRKMQRLLTHYKPDLVIFTHPFACCAAASLRRSRWMSVPMAAVLTDFAVHRLWVNETVDAYFVASGEMKEALLRFGIRESKVNVSGIPISCRYGGVGERLAAAVDGGEPAVLVMGGGTGFGAMDEALISLAGVDRRMKITVATGNNALLRQRLSAVARHVPHTVNILGFTDRIHELMAEATVLITKPGALTCSEALATGLPMILTSPIPGQEEENASFLLRQGAAIRIDDTSQLGPALGALLADPEKLAMMREKALPLGRPQAAGEVVRTVARRFLASQDMAG